MKKYLLLALPVVMAAAPAAAQDASGFRVEGVALYDKIKGHFGTDPDQFNPVHDRDFDVAYGVGLGYDFGRMHGVTAGADVELTESTAKRTVLDDNGNELGESKIGTDYYVGGRVTAPVSGNFSVYGKLGYTYARVSFDSDDDTVDFPNSHLSGYRAGLGVHYAGDGDKTYYGAEYRYSNYSDGVSRHQVGLVIGTHF